MVRLFFLFKAVKRGSPSRPTGHSRPPCSNVYLLDYYLHLINSVLCFHVNIALHLPPPQTSSLTLNFKHSTCRPCKRFSCATPFVSQISKIGARNSFVLINQRNQWGVGGTPNQQGSPKTGMRSERIHENSLQTRPSGILRGAAKLSELAVPARSRRLIQKTQSFQSGHGCWLGRWDSRSAGRTLR
jgi:hypothetical protein